jgi:hypothetical protein
MFTEKQKAVLHSHKFKQMLAHHDDKHITVCKQQFKTSDVKAFYTDSQKYTGIEDEGMGHIEPSGDHEDSGDGDSQEQE